MTNIITKKEMTSFQDMLEVINQNYQILCEKYDTVSDNYYLKTETIKETLPKIQNDIITLDRLKEKVKQIKENEETMMYDFLSAIERKSEIKEQYKKVLECKKILSDVKEKYMIKEIEKTILELLTFKNYDGIIKKIQENRDFIMSMKSYRDTLVEKFKKICVNLLNHIEFPFDEEIDIDFHRKTIDEIKSNMIVINMLFEECEDKPFILEMLLSMINERYNLHFNSKSLTNNPAKPELLLTALNNWYTSNIGLISKLICPILKKDISWIDGKFKDMLLSLCIDKINDWLRKDKVMNDPELLGHLLDSVLFSVNEVEGLYSLNEGSTKSLLSIFYDDEDILERWLCIEKQTLKIVLNKFLDSLFNNKELENFVECKEYSTNVSDILFVIQSSCQRYEMIKKVEVKKLFIQQILEGLFLFKNDLLDIESSQEYAVCNVGIKITNILIKIHSLLKEMELYLFNENEEIFTFEINILGDKITYDKILYSFKEVWLKLIDSQCNELLKSLDKYFIPYTNERWHGMTRNFMNNMNTVNQEITESFLHFIYQLRNTYLKMETMYPSKWLEIIVDKMNHKLFLKIIDDFIMKKNFNEYGAKQVIFDIKNGLFTMLNDIFIHNDQYGLFKDSILCNSHYIKLLDYLNLLSMHPAVGLLLKDAAKDNPDEILIPKLEEFNFIGIITREEILKILDRKCDLLS
ncbi:RAD50-interacting protein 1 [Strongyloides ratti]|uniref:RAD50-interacting protein 1 n=1 Tax=Strongyloides ratti TaxID=34506 RepID=A0A090LH76_STRRB|nr:RAD50-interacting protein 1 [Strongyloides ratti]CEF69146.1 RAD50-interacting protein 1 [Strongyloides ratti]